MRRAQGTAPVPNRIVQRIVRAVPADEDTVRKVIDGKPVRGSIGIRVRSELERRGFCPPTVTTN
jgi:hypothetical protein